MTLILTLILLFGSPIPSVTRGSCTPRQCKLPCCSCLIFGVATATGFTNSGILYFLRSICLIGATGVGKSSVGNVLGNVNDPDEKEEGEPCTGFVALPSCQSVTFDTSIQTLSWFDGTPVTIIDTPGLGDSEGRDADHIANMCDNLKLKRTVNMFALVFNGEDARLNIHMKGMLRVFSEMFGVGFLDHACIIFTHWSADCE